ncbi:MAG: DMT family transporter [Candidatus Geothermarchaeales archaeon]
MPRIKGYATVAAISLFWGLAFVAIKSSLEVLSPIGLTMLRLAASSILFLLYLAIWERGRSIPNLRDLPMMALLGLFGFTVYHLSLNLGQQYTTVGLASLVVASAPIFIVMFSVSLLNERLTFTRGSGIVVAFLGVSALIFLGHENPTTGAPEILGATMILPAPITAALYTVLGKPLLRRYSPTVLVAWALFFGTAFVLPFVSLDVVHESLRLSMVEWIPILFLAFFPTFIGYILWYRLLAEAEASGVGAYLYLTTMTAIVGGIVLLGETITLHTVVGGSLVVVGVAMAQKAQNTDRLQPKLQD